MPTKVTFDAASAWARRSLSWVTCKLVMQSILWTLMSSSTDIHIRVFVYRMQPLICMCKQTAMLPVTSIYSLSLEMSLVGIYVGSGDLE